MTSASRGVVCDGGESTPSVTDVSSDVTMETFFASTLPRIALERGFAVSFYDTVITE